MKCSERVKSLKELVVAAPGQFCRLASIIGATHYLFAPCLFFSFLEIVTAYVGHSYHSVSELR